VGEDEKERKIPLLNSTIPTFILKLDYLIYQAYGFGTAILIDILAGHEQMIVKNGDTPETCIRSPPTYMPACKVPYLTWIEDFDDSNGEVNKLKIY